MSTIKKHLTYFCQVKGWKGKAKTDMIAHDFWIPAATIDKAIKRALWAWRRKVKRDHPYARIRRLTALAKLTHCPRSMAVETNVD